MKLRNTMLAALLALGAGAALAAETIAVKDPWVRASAPGQRNGAGYMTIENAGQQPDTLLAVSSPAAERIELHNVVTENGVASMRPVDGVPVPAQGQARLAPGGYHVMFLKLQAPFKQGEQVQATLRFEKAGEIPVTFAVQPATYNPGGGHGNHEHGGHGHGGHADHKH
ncbi:copper chaperone PCu(A)C [Orrella sp. JC864]|uniref:copper chaperone PCu(A)C n=1 Tax=Orrella sp. JC864 TaxID=3120298 RepID=UPI0030086C3D